MSAQAGQMPNGRKLPQVLAGARTVFLRDGFVGASVDDIAREAGVSKATLYSYFADKRLMYAAVFRAELAQEVKDARVLVDIDLPFDQVLPFVVQIISAQLFSEFGVRVFRMAVAEFERFPTLAEEYYERGPNYAREQLIQILRVWTDRGELMIDDFELAADQLVALTGASIRNRLLLLGPERVEPELMKRVNEGAVRAFIACYGAQSNSPDAPPN